MSGIAWLNAALGLLAVLAAFGALNKMHFRRTLPCIAGGMLCVLLGAGGNVIGALLSDWQPYADTLLLGGVVALILGTQRVPTWLGERWANPLASVVVLVALGAAAVLVALS